MTDIETINSATQKPSKWRLTKVVKTFLDISYALSLLGLCILVISTVLIGLNIPDNPDERHTDIDFHFSYVVYDAPITDLSLHSNHLLRTYADEPTEVIRGSSDIKLNNTKSHIAWYVSKLILLIFVVMSIFAIKILLKLFTNLDENLTFHEENPGLLKHFGFIVIAWSVLEPVVIYLGGMAILDDVGEHANYIDIYPAFYLNPNGVFIGLGILILAQIMKEAYDMREEQELTI